MIIHEKARAKDTILYPYFMSLPTPSPFPSIYIKMLKAEGLESAAAVALRDLCSECAGALLPWADTLVTHCLDAMTVLPVCVCV